MLLKLPFLVNVVSLNMPRIVLEKSLNLILKMGKNHVSCVCFATVNAHMLFVFAVCSSVDIRNNVSEFSWLENCSVIEGHLQILLMDYTRAEDFEHLSFPNLREIADYLLLYRVYGMQTLSHIFPNLVSIRGQTLFFNYALVVFEMQNLEDLGLWNLRSIVRGAVRIERNPRLCYVDTINWSAILSSKKVDNFILQNRDTYECVNVCPKHSCPTVPVSLDNGEKFNQPLCWNADHCQSG